MDYEAFFKQALHNLKKEGKYRTFIPLARDAARPGMARFQQSGQSLRDVVVWCSNDYLSMSTEPTVLAAMHKGLDENGAGAGGTRNIAGTNLYHLELETALANWYQKPSALIFSSGYTANLATLGALGRKIKDCIYISDSENHNSMIEGMRHSGARRVIFRHNDMTHLEECLQAIPLEIPKIIVFESVYSMSGDIAPLRIIVDLAKKYKALSYVDEVHAVGLYGQQGSGRCEEEGLCSEIDIIQGTLAKGVGIVGGFIASQTMLTDFIRSFGYAFIFSTALPPSIAAGAVASIRLLRQSSERRLKHQTNARLLTDLFKKAGLPVRPTSSHIVPVMIGDPFRCKNLADGLLEDGHYVQPINYPTVPAGEERLRFAPGPQHTVDMMEDLVACLKKRYADL